MRDSEPSCPIGPGGGEVERCPGVDETLGRHAHTLPDRPRASYGGRLTRGVPAAERDGSASLVAFDRDPINWCANCQNTLITCYRAGCGAARGELVGMAMVAARWATAIVADRQAGYGSSLSAAEFTAFETLALEKIVRRLPRLRPDEASAGARTNSLVGFLAYFVHQPGDSAELLAQIRRRAPVVDPLTIDGDRSFDETALPAVDPTAPDDDADRSAELMAAVAAVRAKLAVAVADLPPVGRRSVTAGQLLDAYLAQFLRATVNVREHELAPQRRSDRDVALSLDLGNRTVSLYRPKLDAALAAAGGELNTLEHAFLGTFLEWLRTGRGPGVRLEPGERDRDPGAVATLAAPDDGEETPR